MRTNCTSNLIEALESRIAPAALVTAALDHGKLTLAGDDNGDNFTLTQLGPKLFRLNATNATEFRLEAGGIPTTVLDIMGTVSSISATFGAGSDSFTFQGLKLSGGVTIHNGEGANYPALRDCSIGGDVSISGGATNDIVVISGNNTVIGGKLSIDSGAGGNTTSLTGHKLSLGSLSVLGSGGQNLQASVQLLTVKGGIDIDNSTSTGSTSTFSNTIATIGGIVALHGGAGDDSFYISGVRTSIKGDLKIEGGDGFANVGVSPVSLLVGGDVVLTLGANVTANPEYIQFNPSHQLTIGGDLSLEAADGQHIWAATADLIGIAGSVSLVEGNHAVSVNAFTLRGTDQLHVGKGLSVQQGAGAFVTNVTGGTLLQIGGAVSITNGDHVPGFTTSVSFNSALVTKLGGAVEIHGGNGAHSTSIIGTESLSIGPLSVTGGADKDAVTVTGAKTRISGAASFELGLGDADVQLNAITRLDIAGDAHFTGSGSFTSFRINAGAGLINGKVGGDFGTSAQGQLQLSGSGGLLQIAKGLDLAGADATNFYVSLGRVGVSGATSIATGAGADDIAIDDSIFSGTVNVALGDGADQLRIERLDTTHAAITAFLKGAHFDLGAGDQDQLALGGALATERVIVAGPAIFDGGAGISDTYKDQPTNIFKITGQPLLIGFE